MPADEDDPMVKMMQMAAQFLPTIVLSSEAKVWSELVLAFVRSGEGVETAIQKADHVLTEHRLRFGSDRLKSVMLENAPKADLRAIR